MAPNAWPGVIPWVDRDTIRCPEYSDSSFELNLLQPFILPANKPGTAPETRPATGPGTVIHDSPDRKAGGRGAAPARWVLLAALAVLLSLSLAACTRNIGGVSSGWNAPVSANGVVYVGTKDGQVQALVDSGYEGVRASWTFPQAEGAEDLQGVYSTPLVVGGLLYVAAESGFVYALDLENGSVSDRGWRRPLGGSNGLEPLVAGPAYDPINELILIASEDGNLYGYDADTGDEIWDRPFMTGDKIWSTPAVSDTVAYFGSHDHHVYAVNTSTGKEKWSFQTGGVVAGRPLLLGDMVIAGSFDKNLYALDASDGSVRWQFEAENWFWAGAVSNGETIFAPNMDGHVYALDREGILRWQYDVGSSIVSPPVLVPRGLVVAAKDGRLILLDVSTAADRTPAQRELSSQTLGDAEIKAPLFQVGESVYVGSEDGSVRRVEVKGGQVQIWCWHYENTQCN